MPDPGAKNLGGPPAAASVSITSRPERAAWPVRPIRDWVLSATFGLMLMVPSGCLIAGGLRTIGIDTTEHLCNVNSNSENALKGAAGNAAVNFRAEVAGAPDRRV
jgi:hypothetical protein